MGTAWERHGHGMLCELAFKIFKLKYFFVEHGPYITEVQDNLTLIFSKISNCIQKNYVCHKTQSH